MQVVRVALGALAVVLLVAALASQWDEITEALERLTPASVAGAFAFVLAGLLANMLSWREVLAGLGNRLPVVDGARVYLLSQLGKYLPGSLWPVVAQIELARDHGVSRVRSAVAAVVALAVGAVVGVSVAVAGLAGGSGESDVSWWWAVLAGAVAVAVLRPRALGWLLRTAFRLVGRPDTEVEIDGRAVARSAAWSLAMWLLLGAQVWLLARDLDADANHLFVLSVGAYAAAWVVGLLVVIAPAGAGAREAALVVALGSALSRPDALALAVVSRMLTMVGDGACGLLAVVSARRARRRSPAPAPIVGVEPGG
jgi:uncharacterized membrane protein YbhN (UPF0104 family)